MSRPHRILTVALFSCLVVPAAPASAQATTAPAKGWISVSGGVQPATNSFSDAFDLPLNAETERVSVAYPVKGGVLVAGSGGYRVWKQMSLGVGVTQYQRRAAATVEASLPHPFFDSQPRHVQGTTPATRTETGVHLLAGWMMPVSPRIRLLLTAGPSFINVGQTLVTGVQYSEVYPYDAALYTGAATKKVSASATGFSAGADLFWMFSRSFGAGGLVQVTHARAKETADGRSVTVDAGGAQVGVGLRLLF